MRTSRLLACCVALPLAAACAHNPVSRHVTPAGHEFRHLAIRDAERTAVRFNWGSGLTGLPAGRETGAAIGGSMMLNAGTARRAPDELLADFQDLDASAELLVWPDRVGGMIVAASKNLTPTAELANEVLTQPNFDPRWFERMRGSLLETAQSHHENSWGIAGTLAREAMIGDHALKRYMSLEPWDEIRALTVGNIADWHRTAFDRSALTVVSAGGADPASVGRSIDAALDGLPAESTPPIHDFPALSIVPQTIVFHDPHAEKSVVQIFGSISPRRGANANAFDISIDVLGGGQKSRLFEAVRTSLRATYGYGAGFSDFTRNRRVLVLGGEVDTELLPNALATIESTYDEFLADGIDAEEFSIAKRAYRERMRGVLQTPGTAARLLMEYHLDGRPEDHVATLIDRIDALDRDAVNTLIVREFPPFSEMMTIIVTPDPSGIESDCIVTDLRDIPPCV